MKILKRLMTWLCPQRVSPTQQLRTWLQSLQQIPDRCAVSPEAYISLCAHLEATRWFIVFWDYGDKMAGVKCDGVWIFPDPTVTELTAR